MVSPHDLTSSLVGGMSMGIGGLPYRSFRDAFEPSVRGTDIATVPTLPRRSPAENMIAQAVVGIRGVSLGQYGSIAIDVDLIDPFAFVSTDLNDAAYASFRQFLKHAAGHSGPVKWQFVGPVTLGAVLQRAGVHADVAYQVAMQAIRAHIDYLLTRVERALPGCVQIVVLDEPNFGVISDQGSTLAPDAAVDLLSGALAAIEPAAISGVHCCEHADIAALLAAGPTVLSVPSSTSLIDSAGYLQRFLEHNGWIAWGAVPTDGPLPTTSDRCWRQLSDLWCQLVQRGCDPSMLRRQSLITPECGLSDHTMQATEQILRLTREVSARVKDQSLATRLVLGA